MFQQQDNKRIPTEGKYGKIRWSSWKSKRERKPEKEPSRQKRREGFSQDCEEDLASSAEEATRKHIYENLERSS